MLKLVAFLLVIVAVTQIEGHGRFIKPPNRSSIWRFPEFAHHNPPQNYGDNELYCGGLHQQQVVGGNCGVCGDSWDQGSPRANEIGGTWDRGIIVGEYNQGQTIDIEVELTVGHLGYMQFRLCDNQWDANNQGCYRHLLELGSGGTNLQVTSTGLYRSSVRLPQGVTCDRCVIQWNYRAGNNWGDCGDGTQAPGCGPQETFRGCSDIRIR